MKSKIDCIVESVAMLTLIIITLDTTYIVFARYFLDVTYPWGEEIAILSWIWLGFISSALAVRDDTHLRISFYDKHLPKSIIKISNLINRIIMFVFCIFGIYLGIKMCIISQFSTLSGTGINTSFLYLPIPIGFILMAYYLLKEKIDGNDNSNNNINN